MPALVPISWAQMRTFVSIDPCVRGDHDQRPAMNLSRVAGQSLWGRRWTAPTA
jgi:hypothetical protein